MKVLTCLILVICSGFLMAQTPEIEIKTQNNTAREQSTLVLVKEVLAEYDLEKWIFTHHVVIEQGTIPHSHPVLTLNTRSTNKVDILATFIHEQLHWYVDKFPESEKKAIAAFKKRYPEVPYQNRAGARDEYSTYLHLIVCYLEYQSMISLIGKEKAKQLMWNQNHYTWIYNKVIEDEVFIAKVVLDNGFDLLK